MTEKLHRELLVAELKESFPELIDGINAEMGELTFEVEVFRQFMQEMIDTCFLEDLDFNDSKKRTRAWARDLLSKDLKTAYDNFRKQFK